MFQRRREDRARSVRRADAPSGLRGLTVVSGRTNPDRTKQGSARWMRAGRRLIVFRDREDKSVPRPASPPVSLSASWGNSSTPWGRACGTILDWHEARLEFGPDALACPPQAKELTR